MPPAKVLRIFRNKYESWSVLSFFVFYSFIIIVVPVAKAVGVLYKPIKLKDVDTV